MALLHTSDLNQPSTGAGVPLAGAKLYFYQEGTTTPITVYQDKALSTPHASPVVADASGIFPPIWVNEGTNSTYKTVLTNAADVTIRTVDGIVTPSVDPTGSLTDPAAADTVFAKDATDSTRKEITLQNLWKVINALTAGTAPDKADTLALYDQTGSASITITLENLLKVINTLTAETVLAAGDEIGIYDLSATAVRKVTIQSLFNAINVLTAETAPAIADVIALYDADGSATDKITLADLLKVVNGLTEDTSPDTANDFLLAYDVSAGAAKKVKPDNLTIGSWTLHPSSPIDASTGSSDKEFTSIPSGVNKMTLGFRNVSFNGNADIQVLLGTASAYVTSGYTMNYFDPAATGGSSNEIDIPRSNNADHTHGFIEFRRMESDVWHFTGVLTRNDTSDALALAGTVDLGATLTRLSVGPATAANFDGTGATLTLAYET